jgi:site-specific recombinase XerD
MMSGGDLYELAKILGHWNIKMTERYAKLARQHIARTSGTARELWKILEPQCANAANVGETNVRVLYARVILNVFGCL